MTSERFVKLYSRIGKRLIRSFRRLAKLSRRDSPVIDVTIYFPPDEDDGSIATLGEIDRQGESIHWEFEVKKSDWKLRGDKFRAGYWFPGDLHAVLVALFRKCWSEFLSGEKRKFTGYLSLHDSTTFINLGNGRKFEEHERVDYESPKRKPFKSGRDIVLPHRPNGELPLGKTLKTIQALLGTDELPDERGVLYLPKVGGTFNFKNGKLDTAYYFHPFHRSVADLRIGEGINKVLKRLGEPGREEYSPWKGAHRVWYYRDRKLRISFNHKDCINGIYRFS